MRRKETSKWEFGDFQTPVDLASAAVALLSRRGLAPATIIAPSCGVGAFLVAALRAFPRAECVLAADINPEYLAEAGKAVADIGEGGRCELLHADFFRTDWRNLIASKRTPLLVLGNPPWVTSAELGSLRSENLPEKSNFQQLRGIEAISGKSNFDISEWMLIEYLRWLEGREGAVAVLCKTSVARKVLVHALLGNASLSSADMHLIDAKRHFGAAVDACLLVMTIGSQRTTNECNVFQSIEADRPLRSIGLRDGCLVSDASAYDRHRHLRGADAAYTWRSGIKHDCSKVMELEPDGHSFRNALGESVLLEGRYLYPMLKSSDVASETGIRYGRKYMLVTQSAVGEDTAPIRKLAPLTWSYLERHRASLDKRASSIYRNRPRYSVFGVGDYAFAPWKLAISGFYKSLTFKVVAPVRGRPVVFDDTVYFLPCWTAEEADFVADLLNSEVAQAFLGSLVFWDDKRPITIEVLKKLNLRALAAEVGREVEYAGHARRRRDLQAESSGGQMALGVAEAPAEYATPGSKVSRRRTVVAAE